MLRSDRLAMAVEKSPCDAIGKIGEQDQERTRSPLGKKSSENFREQKRENGLSLRMDGLANGDEDEKRRARPFEGGCWMEDHGSFSVAAGQC